MCAGTFKTKEDAQVYRCPGWILKEGGEAMHHSRTLEVNGKWDGLEKRETGGQHLGDERVSQTSGT